eukprot:TRINITY_DN740_c0_g1_i1.p1 TRINITY_DN740_c0_g1~~TRINITY_DN740_c0_g1_i1.p1  ORF type:complete len:543 (-),score=82.62 TRINITY_DN740_c0_g1_i1:187-1815(-)
MSEVMEIESRQSPERRGLCFPISCACCPTGCRAAIPAGWMKIQDCTHLMLLCGVLSGIALVVMQVQEIIRLQWSVHLVWECMIVVFISPCTLYFTTIIQQYDDRLQEKQKNRQQKKADLTRAYNGLLTEMDGFLKKSAESTAGLAERSFESKRRDFQRFLERVKARFAEIRIVQSTNSPQNTNSPQLLAQFRGFCSNWLHVFEECSIDPIQAPKKVVSKEDLNRCTNIPEICDLCLEKLRVTEVRFLSMQRDHDAQMLRKNQNDLRRITGDALDIGRSFRTDSRSVSDAMLEQPGSKKCSWFSCGTMTGCRVVPSESRDGYPKDICFLCGRLTILSREHAILLTAWFMGIIFRAIELSYRVVEMKGADWRILEDVYISLGLQMVTQVTIIMVLCKFEELDMIQQLDREVTELQKNTENVQTQQQTMHDFWSNAQQLTELWLYRTVPRMDLYKEVHSQLEDVSNEDLLVMMCGANRVLEDLDHRLGDLEAWRLGGTLSLENKKQFGKTVNAICGQSDFGELLVSLEMALHDGLACLEAPVSVA